MDTTVTDETNEINEINEIVNSELLKNEGNKNKYQDDVEGEKLIQIFETDMDALRETVMESLPITNGHSYTYHDENSPLTMSAENSDDEKENENGNGYGYGSGNGNDNPPSVFRKLTFDDIQNSLEKYYQENDSILSNELDALITFIKGQKHLFLQSRNYTQHQLHLFILPAICISGFIAMFSSFFEEYEWSGGLIAGFNGVVAILISLSNYFKLEGNAHSYYLSAFQYDKLESGLEFVASKVAFLQNEKEKEKIILEKIHETEQKINEMKEWNHLFVPSEVQKIFPIICHINIFSFIKRLETNKKLLLSKFQYVKNEIRYISFQFEKQDKMLSMQERHRLECRIQTLLKTKEIIKHDLFCYRNAYSYLDDLFNAEIQCAENYRYWSFFKKQKCNREKKNPIVDQFLHSHMNT